MAKQKKFLFRDVTTSFTQGMLTFLRKHRSMAYFTSVSARTRQFLTKGEDLSTLKRATYMVSAIRYVEKAWINSGSGPIDFKDDLIQLSPDILMVNEDGHSLEKEQLCKS